MGDKREEVDPHGWKSSFTQTTEEVARAVVAAAAAVRPRPSIVFTSNNNNSNRAFERLQRHIARVWRQGFSGESSKKAFFNPEHLTSQKRQWAQLQLQMLERKRWVEPSCLFEHMVVVGLHPETDTQALEAALLKRRSWEKELEGPERLRDTMRQQFRGLSPPIPEAEILYSFPPGKKLPMRQKDLIAFCYPGGVEAYSVERTPSMSELNEIVYGQDHVMRDDLSYVFLLKVADNATLYGVCVYVPQLVKQTPGLMTLGSNLRSRSSPAPLSRFSLTTYRCYCLLTKLPFFDLHFEVLNSIITQERLERITECVNEMTVSPYESGGSELSDGVNAIPPSCTEQYGLSIDLSPIESNEMHQTLNPFKEANIDHPAAFANGDFIASNNKVNDSCANEHFGRAAAVVEDPVALHNLADQETAASMSSSYDNGGLSKSSEVKEVCFNHQMTGDEERVSSMSTEERLHRVDSLESVNSTVYSFRQSITSDDDEAEEESLSGQDCNSLSRSELVWTEDDHCLLRILCEYYKLHVPARGSSFVFQPLEHLPPLNFKRLPNETSTLLGGRSIDPSNCQTSLEIVEAQSALAAAEEAAALSIWSVATLCRVLSLENVLSLFSCALLEKQIVIVCPNLGVLSAVVLSTIPLIRPFQWQSLMLPILPNQMLDFLDAPVPYVVGVLQKTSALRSKSSSVVVVNVQRDKVSMPSTPFLPHRRELYTALDPYHRQLAAEVDYAKRHPVHMHNDAQFQAADSFLSVLRSYLESICKNLRSHTITNVQSNNDKVSLLLKDSFVEDFESKDQAFMKLFVDTQLFSVHTDAVLSYIESS
ncbi:hypothetical protein KP509_27G065400 [Ceratopteris richardii]|uniref:UDENN domain-containing protein n=1 Tax=Ceratopteris richardii TaxID=49495 RepID=A0A8T2RIW0_CERRI|nr:hypothetical protein KP509_27G065400 [Ceratopteris richardii]